jgi:hypothetical protein
LFANSCSCSFCTANIFRKFSRLGKISEENLASKEKLQQVQEEEDEDKIPEKEEQQPESDGVAKNVENENGEDANAKNHEILIDERVSSFISVVKSC